MGRQKIIDMPPERQAGLFFGAAIVCLLIVVVIVLVTTRSSGLQYTLLFSDARGLKPGDRVVMSGVDIGEVASVDFDEAGEKIAVGVKIYADHESKVRIDSTGYIRDTTMLNVSGQKVVEIANAATPSGPMPNGAIVQGKGGTFEFRAWQVKEKIEEWGSDIGAATKELASGAREAARKLKDKYIPPKGDEADDKKVIPEGGAEEGGDESPRAVSPEEDEGDGADDPESAEGLQLYERLGKFMAGIPEKARGGMDKVKEEWAAIKAMAGPIIAALIESGKKVMSDRLQMILDIIEEFLGAFPQGDPAEPAEQNEDLV